ncbi:hypothetical protein M427DRAFT_391584 [Gonapodya prolifera JEL478]|uniref:Cupin type-2 domain-containing protein n=1 Tax=Gonapodya prolifera (strain JEL478) TaxID=1344416 RepID=A0A139A7S9_GONPJ|nr:hypothetical protein M427DRAFT_391584 [Gonapodya prolifera JEL478]|eukprot:KXS12749.1 hypothetical protein M427DRAFT_391584 [Gonapodya prolifera JEL478]
MLRNSLRDYSLVLPGELEDNLWRPRHLDYHLTQGICRIPPGKALKKHHHSHVETYYVLEGEALMETGTNPDGSVSMGAGRRLKAGDAVFLPGNCPHRTFNDSVNKDFVFLYTFGADKFSDAQFVIWNSQIL